MINQKSSEKTNTLLIMFVVVLAVILSAEMYYLFIYKKQQNIDSTTKVVEDSLTTKKPPISNLYKKIPEAEVNKVYDNIPSRIEISKTAYKNGVLSELILTERYKSIIIDIGKTQTTREFTDGKERKFDFIMKFSNMAEEGKKDMSLLLTDKEVKRISTYKTLEDEEVEIDLSEFNAGDLVEITIETSLLANPSDSLKSMKLVKLL